MSRRRSQFAHLIRIGDVHKDRPQAFRLASKLPDFISDVCIGAKQHRRRFISQQQPECRNDMIYPNRRHLNSRDRNSLGSAQFTKLDRGAAAVSKSDVLEVRPHVVVEHVLPERRYHLFACVDADWTIENGKCFGDVNRQRSRVIAVGVSHDHVADGADLAWSQREPEASAVYRKPVIDDERSQRLKLRLASSATWQKFDPHARRLRLWRYKVLIDFDSQPLQKLGGLLTAYQCKDII